MVTLYLKPIKLIRIKRVLNVNVREKFYAR